jgi:hypothetical protein
MCGKRCRIYYLTATFIDYKFSSVAAVMHECFRCGMAVASTVRYGNDDIVKEGKEITQSTQLALQSNHSFTCHVEYGGREEIVFPLVKLAAVGGLAASELVKEATT